MPGTALDRSESVSWSGTGTGTDGSTGQQSLSVDINPAIDGPAFIRVYLAKDQTVYVDPNPELS